MPDQNRPRGRVKNITGTGKSVNRRGSGLGSGPVGSGNAGRTNSGSPRNGASGSQRGFRQQGEGTTRSSSGTKKAGIPTIIVLLAALIFGGKSFLGGSSTTTTTTDTLSTTQDVTSSTGTTTEKPASSGSLIESLLGGSGYGYGYGYGYGSGSSSTSSSGSNASYGWTGTPNTGKLDSTVASAARKKYVTPVGNGDDTVTIMVYLCGTDLESKSGMATSDMQEMAKASLSDNVNLILYTGGCSKWQISGISTKTNQIYQLTDGKLKTLESDAGNKAMTSPATLTSFIQYCTENFPADRNMLIFWDHGGGSLSGYGYDQRFPNSGSMTLDGIQTALKDAKTKFDFIGFDACLMATAETALMLDDYADYLIASEETEPGIGWYYTNWLTDLSANTSISTLELGKKIADDFVSTCAANCSGQKATLSVIDLGELAAVLPDSLHTFSVATEQLIQEDYQAVSYARSSAREFASSSKIDQVDLVSMALKMETDEGQALADALLGAVKYNRVSTNMTDAYGISIYFPYQKLSGVSTAVSTYEALGLDDAYSDCIRSFATMQTTGQAAGGGSHSSAYSSLYSSYSSGSSYGSGNGSSSSGSYSSYSGSSSGSSSSSYNVVSGSSALTQMLQALLGGDFSSFSDSSLSSDLFGRSLEGDRLASTADYVAAHSFDPTALLWQENEDGSAVLELSEDQWALVHNLELSLYVDDGEGYIDLGLDNVFEFTEDGSLLGSFDGTWLAINGQPVAYYHLNTTGDGDLYCITGRVPVLLNGERADLILVFDNDNPYGYISGVSYDYRNGETETVAKLQTELQEGDTIDFLCDFYTYEGEYSDSYMFGEQMIYNGEIEISNVYLPEDVIPCAMYKITDLYCQPYWTPVIPE